MDGIGMFQNENGWNGNGWNENVTECLVKFQNDIEMYGMVTFQVENEQNGYVSECRKSPNSEKKNQGEWEWMEWKCVQMGMDRIGMDGIGMLGNDKE